MNEPVTADRSWLVNPALIILVYLLPSVWLVGAFVNLLAYRNSTQSFGIWAAISMLQLCYWLAVVSPFISIRMTKVFERWTGLIMALAILFNGLNLILVYLWLVTGND